MKNSLPPPPKMGNGGSPPAHLPLSTATDDLWYPSFADFPLVAAKWMQPPAHAPDLEWMHEWTHGIWDILGTLDDWFARGMDKDLASAAEGELPRAYGYFVLLAVCSAICSAKFGFFLPGRTLNG